MWQLLDFRRFSMAALGMLALTLSGFAQTADSLTVRIDNIFFGNITDIRGRSAGFPYPVFTFISIRDSNDVHISRLASDTTWIGPDDVAENGRTIRQNWPLLNEYLQADPSRPAISDLFRQNPPPVFTELSDSSGPVILRFYVMAHSSPLPCGDENVNGDSTRVISVAVDDGLRGGFTVNTYRYRGPVKSYDVALNKTATADTVSIGGSFQYQLNASNLGPDIAYNMTLTDSLPAFLLPSGFNIAPDSITGSLLYWSFDSLVPGSDLNLTYTVTLDASIPDGVNEFSTSSRFNAFCDSDILNNSGQDTIYVDRPAGTLFPNLQLFGSVLTDSFAVAGGGDTLWFAEESESYVYTLRVRNIGSESALAVSLQNILPDSVSAGGTSGGDTLVWQLGTLAPLADTTVSFMATVVPVIPFADFPLINRATAGASNEPSDSLDNNTAIDTVFAYPGSIITLQPDLTLSVGITSDSLQISGGDSIWYVREDETYDYALRVRNTGTLAAGAVLLQNILPDSVFGATISGGDTLVWQLGTLPPGADTTVFIEATVVSRVPLNNFLLINRAAVTSPDEPPGNLANNTRTDTVLAIRAAAGSLLPDLEIRQSVQSDSFRVVAGDTSWFVEPAEIYPYTIHIRNSGGATAQDVQVRDRFPAQTSIENNSIIPMTGVLSGDTLVWQLGDLAAAESRTLHFNAVVNSSLPIGLNRLVNTAAVSAANEDPSDLANNSSVDTVFAETNATTALREACEFFTLEANVFEPDKDPTLGIQFELKSSTRVVLDILDISGYRIRTLFGETFSAGVNVREWDGNTDDGKTAGSGVYIITLQTEDNRLICWRKVIVRR